MDMLPDSLLFLYGSILLGPFVQEDAAVLYAAGLAESGKLPKIAVFLTIWLGLCLSDYWKYWLGWWALKHPQGQKQAQKDKVIAMGDKVQGNLFKTLLVGRFIPLARIPTYFACGYFHVPYWKYCLGITITALLYITVVFTVVATLGMVMGEHLKWILPVVAITVLLTVIATYFIRRRTDES
ncbi:DedA family protein [Fretibacter rubidus]|uniref:DedA family protein n=1 Tax=Fretibacter rubidus TaxID=570162 RepID=UPI00352AB21D